jgi:4-alpha-glucanotransferase
MNIEDIHWEWIRLAMASVADLAIVPAQDLLGAGEESRMNLPSRSKGNWAWRFFPGQLTDQIGERLAQMTRIYHRVETVETD